MDSPPRRTARRRTRKRVWYRHPLLWIVLIAALAAGLSHRLLSSFRERQAERACAESYRNALASIGPRLSALLASTVKQDMQFLSQIQGKRKVSQEEADKAQAARTSFRDQLNELSQKLKALDPVLYESLQKTQLTRVSETHSRVTTMVATVAKGDPLSVSDDQMKENLAVKMAEWEVGKSVDREIAQAMKTPRHCPTR